MIYLWAPDEAVAQATFDDLAKHCEDYAFRFCWEVVETIQDVGGSNEHLDRRAQVNVCGRPGFDRVFALLRESKAVIVLVPDARMVGGTSQVYNAVCERVERYGGFVQVVGGAANGAEPTPIVEAG